MTAMTATRYYQIFLLMPVLLPLAALAAFAAGVETFFLPLDFVLGTLAVSGIFGGIPYLLLALPTVLWMRRKNLQQIRRRAKLMPLLLIPLYAAAAVIYILLEGGSLTDGLALALVGSLYILPIGYVYVGAALLSERLLVRYSCVLEADA
jgi:hypothetical protein